MQEDPTENGTLLDQVKALRGILADEVEALQTQQQPLINQVWLERDSLEMLLQTETQRANDLAQEHNRAIEQMALLENRLRQRGEESEQAWAAARANEAELAALRAAATESQQALEAANAWVLRLAGERRQLELDNAAQQHAGLGAQSQILKLSAQLLKLERELAQRKDDQQAAQANLDHLRHRLKAEQEAASAAFGQALTRSSELAHMQGLLRAREAELAHAQEETARLAQERHQALRHHETVVGQFRADLDKVQQELATARDTAASLAHDSTAQTRAAEISARKLNWLVELKAAEARSPSWWRFLPRFLRGRLQFRYLARKAIFDADAYRARYPDVAAARMDPLEHYITHGLHQERLPF